MQTKPTWRKGKGMQQHEPGVTKSKPSVTQSKCSVTKSKPGLAQAQHNQIQAWCNQIQARRNQIQARTTRSKPVQGMRNNKLVQGDPSKNKPDASKNNPSVSKNNPGASKINVFLVCTRELILGLDVGKKGYFSYSCSYSSATYNCDFNAMGKL